MVYIDLVPARCVAFSLGPMLVDHAVDGAITIAHGDCDGGDEDGQVGVRRASKPGGYCAANATPSIKT